MTGVEPLDVAKFLGRADEPEIIALAQEHLPVVTTFVEAYTRGRGFTNGEPDSKLRSVIITACARMVPNPSQLKRFQAGEYSETPATLEGFNLAEQAVLHLYRRRTQ